MSTIPGRVFKSASHESSPPEQALSLNSIEINANPPSEATASRKTRAVSNCCGAVTGKAGTYNGTLGTEVSTQNNPEISMCNFDQKCLESLSVELLLLLESYF